MAPKPRDDRRGDTSSSEESVEVDSSPPVAPTLLATTAKSKAAPPPSASDSEESSVEEVTAARPATTMAAPERDDDKPAGGKGGKGGVHTCHWCWRKISDVPAARDQHQHYSLYCLTWQRFRQKKCTWSEAVAWAKAKREERLQAFSGEHGVSVDEDDGGKRGKERAEDKRPVSPALPPRRGKSMERAEDKRPVSPPRPPRRGRSSVADLPAPVSSNTYAASSRGAAPAPYTGWLSPEQLWAYGVPLPPWWGGGALPMSGCEPREGKALRTTRTGGAGEKRGYEPRRSRSRKRVRSDRVETAEKKTKKRQKRPARSPSPVRAPGWNKRPPPDGDGDKEFDRRSRAPSLQRVDSKTWVFTLP